MPHALSLVLSELSGSLITTYNAPSKGRKRSELLPPSSLLQKSRQCSGQCCLQRDLSLEEAPKDAVPGHMQGQDRDC